jgi:hypothetical protein
MIATSSLKICALALLAAGVTPALAQLEPTKTVEVRCSAGDRVARALTLGDERKPLVIVVDGVCPESVVIDRSDVTLRAGAEGGGLAGPDPAVDVVTVAATRVTIEGLAITGGRNGIHAVAAPGLVIRGAGVTATGRSGISLGSGSSAVIDACTVARNPRDGVAVDSASAVVLGSTVSENGRMGIVLVNGASARIGIDGMNAIAGSSIRANGSNGIVASLGSSFYLAASEVSGNGTDPAALAGRAGVNLAGASATLIGGNTVRDNASSGVSGFRSASLTIGDPSFGLDTRNVVSRNGTADLSGGVFVFQGSAVIVRNALVADNAGFGLGIGMRSSGQVVGSTFGGNGDGIRILMGGALFVSAPPSTVSGSAGFGVQCLDGESSLVNTVLLGFADNAAGALAPGCTAF